MLDSLSFDPFSLFDDGLSSPAISVSGRHVVEALVVALVVVMLDERFDLDLKIARQEVALQQDAVHEGLMPTLDLTLCLRMERRTWLILLASM